MSLAAVLLATSVGPPFLFAFFSKRGVLLSSPRTFSIEVPYAPNYQQSSVMLKKNVIQRVMWYPCLNLSVIVLTTSSSMC